MAHRLKNVESFPVVHARAAGIDIGSRFHVASIAADLDADPVRTFGTFTSDLRALRDWLVSRGITTVAMESTGVYWIPLYEILAEQGLEVVLVNARLGRNVPGRKSDVNDAQWLQRLHTSGLLRGSFRPAEDILALRSYIRQRECLVSIAAANIQHIQKALDQMNIQLHHVVTDITGVTGMNILHAIVMGEHNPKVLATLRNGSCKATESEISAALDGNYREEHLFALGQCMDLYTIYREKIGDCERAMESRLKHLARTHGCCTEALPAPRAKGKQHQGINFDVRTALHSLTGVDLTQIHGIGPGLALKLVGECGTDMTKWPSAGHFTSWLCLAPGNKVSGGKLLSSQTRRSSNKAAVMLRLAAVTVGKTDTALGAFYRRLAARIGKAKAVTATARKIAVLFYNSLRYGMVYADPGASAYDERYRQRVVSNLRRRAEALGFTLADAPMTVSGGVS